LLRKLTTFVESTPARTIPAVFSPAAVHSAAQVAARGVGDTADLLKKYVSGLKV
jgi:hypothetical protein